MGCGEVFNYDIVERGGGYDLGGCVEVGGWFEGVEFWGFIEYV